MLSISIVLYNSNLEQLSELFTSLKKINITKKVFIIDNSPISTFDLIKHLIKSFDYEYIHNQKNLGYGGAHNIALSIAYKQNYKYHLVVNPDIYFNSDIITPMLSWLNNNNDTALMMPQILNSDGSIQYLPKLLPNIFSILNRKFIFSKSFYNKFINKYELRNYTDLNPINVPVLSGCFTLFNLELVQKIGFYDEDYFLYFEDWDLSRRMHLKYKTIYCPDFFVIHQYHSGANKSIKLFFVFLMSAIKYFSKWGWFFDLERKKINNAVLKQFY